LLPVQVAVAPTRERLLLIAEKLFAQSGIDVVSTRQIAAAAAQRNTGALHYHFGSKDQLIDTLLALRLEPINRRRELLLAQVHRDRRKRDLHALLHVLVQPLLDTLGDPDNHFIGCLQQLYLGDRGERVYANLPSELTSGLDAVGEALDSRLGHLSAAVRHQRLSLMAVQVIYSAATWYYQRERGDLSAPVASLSATLVDFLAGGLLAPVSAPPSSRHLRRPASRTRKKRKG
jgi:AcrR family transcriptional regulator